MRKELRGAMALTLSVLIGAGCVQGVRETELGREGSGRKILIAAYPSEYKKKVAEGLAERYKDRARVTVVPMRKLDSVDYRSYDALVLIDALMAWQMFNIYTRSFITKVREPEQQKKIVLFLTAGDPKPNQRFQDIDCITGASVINTEADAISRISGKVDAVLKKQ
jgi:menaquinone-dependent protoporphyrinogen IX oxidase